MVTGGGCVCVSVPVEMVQRVRVRGGVYARARSHAAVAAGASRRGAREGEGVSPAGGSAARWQRAKVGGRTGKVLTLPVSRKPATAVPYVSGPLCPVLAGGRCCCDWRRWCKWLQRAAERLTTGGTAPVEAASAGIACGKGGVPLSGATATCMSRAHGGGRGRRV